MLKLEKNQEVIKSETRTKKKKLKRWVKGTIFIVIAGGLVFGGYKGFEALLFGTSNNVIDESYLIDEAIKDQANNEAVATTEDPLDLELSGDVSLDWSEDKVLETMNAMTHQFIKASEKRGAVEMTSDKIKALTNTVENSDFGYKDELLTILERWSKKDFSRIDKDHNEILEYQDGTIGTAFGIMSESDQEKFIEQNFRNAGE
jgi:hypothetical protein